MHVDMVTNAERVRNMPRDHLGVAVASTWRMAAARFQVRG